MDEEKRSRLSLAILGAVIDHHDAFLLEVFGPEGCGLSAERVRQLLDVGLADPAAMAASAYATPAPPAGQKALDPFAFLQAMAGYLSEHPEHHMDLKDLTAEQWAGKVYAKAKEIAARPPRPSLDHIEGVRHVDDHHAVGQEVKAPGLPPELLEAKPPAPADAYPEATKKFPGASKAVQAAYQQALDRAGAYCRGLGNRWSDDLRKVVAEKWAGDAPEDVPSPEGRQKTLATIRRLVSDAVATHKNPYKLASDLARVTGDYGRDWKRIALTELQGAFNDGVALEAVRLHGAQAKVARVPESSACADCKRLLLQDGRPIVWGVQELIRNGTNVGKPRELWKATLFCVHPQCMCATVVVPPHWAIQPDGTLRYEGRKAA